MPKVITLEMLHAMTPDQRKTLHHNAVGRDTPAAQAVLELLSQDDLMARPKTAAVSAVPKGASRAAPKKATARKLVKAVHGRQA